MKWWKTPYSSEFSKRHSLVEPLVATVNASENSIRYLILKTVHGGKIMWGIIIDPNHPKWVWNILMYC